MLAHKIRGANSRVPAASPLHPATGVVVGLAATVTVWAAYFLQASIGTGGLFWDVFVVPVLAGLLAAASFAAYLSKAWRKWWLGFAGGLFLGVLVAVAAFVVLAVTLGLD